MNLDQLIKDTKQKMNKAIEHLKQELAGVRSGRANPALIEQVKVETYGSTMPLRDLASINSPEPRLLVVQPWDKGNTDVIIKAVRGGGLGLNPVEENGVIRIPVPQLTEERRRELTKLVHEKAENAKVAVRSLRRDAMDNVEKSGKISKDDRHRYQEQIQKVTDEISGEIDDILESKESELIQI